MKKIKGYVWKSDVMRIVGVTAGELKIYNKSNLVSPSAKTVHERRDNPGYWLYDEDAVGAVYLVKLLRMADFSGEEIKKLQGIENDDEIYDNIQESLVRRRDRLNWFMKFFEQEKELRTLYPDVYEEFETGDVINRTVEYSGKLDSGSFASNIENNVGNEEYFVEKRRAFEMLHRIFEIKRLRGSENGTEEINEKVDSFIYYLIDCINDSWKDDEDEPITICELKEVLEEIGDINDIDDAEVIEWIKYVETLFGKELCGFLGAKIKERVKYIS